MDQLDNQSPYTFNKDAFGNVRIWNLTDKTLLLDKPNLITKQGAAITARALSGLPNTGITHMYVGYNSTGAAPNAVTTSDDISTFGTHAKIPLSFSPSFATGSGYAAPNLVYFTVYISGNSPIEDGKQIVELGLVNATPSQDLLFSRISFNPIVYQAAYGLAITWGLTLQAS
jgi:hypothetical protein